MSRRARARRRFIGNQHTSHRQVAREDISTAMDFGLIKRLVGAGQYGFGGLAVIPRQGDPDADADHDVMPLDAIGRTDRLENPLRHPFSPFVRPCRPLNKNEFVASHPNDAIVLPGKRRESLGDLFEQGIADRMAEPVVGSLEMIEIDRMDRDRAISRSAIMSGRSIANTERLKTPVIGSKRASCSNCCLSVIRSIVELNDRRTISKLPIR